MALPVGVRQDWVTIDWQGRPTRIELQWIDLPPAPAIDPSADSFFASPVDPAFDPGVDRSTEPVARAVADGAVGPAPDPVTTTQPLPHPQHRQPQPQPPLLVFLHEGLGSVSMWRDFPQRCCAALGMRGLVYSRPGYGRSSPRPPQERWQPDFLHRQAHEVLPAVLSAAGVDAGVHPPWLLGHSDGATLALLAAAHAPQHVAGVIAMAPHIFVEPITVTQIERARDAYQCGDLRVRLARHHSDPDSAFWGWNHIWLDPAFRDWSIVGALEAIRAPLLLLQGEQDEYGTIAQIDGITAQLPHARAQLLPDCGHHPHRDHPDTVINAVRALIAAHHRLPPFPHRPDTGTPRRQP